MLHSTMRHLPPTEYCDFLRKLKSRGLHRSNDRPRHIVHTSMFARGRRLDEACFVTTSQGYHSHQIETGLCIRLTLFARRLCLARWTVSRVAFVLFRVLPPRVRSLGGSGPMISQEDYGYSRRKTERRMITGWNWKSTRI